MIPNNSASIFCKFATMDVFLFVLVLFVVLVGGGLAVGKGLGRILFPNEKETYIDKSVHYHSHNITHNHQHQHVSIIDDDSKEKILELKESKNISQSNNNCPNCRYFQTNIFKKKIEECDKCKK